jgi:maltooligosyltrehalose trehalohydrolase
MTPLLFMGQEWAASTPFQYFTDLEPGLGALVTDGRRREFADFPEFASEAARKRIPDPQAESTFLGSKLRWNEQDAGEHRRSLALYRALIALRRKHQPLAGSDDTSGVAASPDDESIVVRRAERNESYWIVARFRSAGEVNLETAAATLGFPLEDADLELVLDTEHGEYAEHPLPIDIAGGVVRFGRPGAVILRCSGI